MTATHFWILYGLVALWCVPYLVLLIGEYLADDRKERRDSVEWDVYDTVFATLFGIGLAIIWPITILWMLIKSFRPKFLLTPFRWYHNKLKDEVTR